MAVFFFFTNTILMYKMNVTKDVDLINKSMMSVASDVSWCSYATSFHTVYIFNLLLG